MFCNWPRTTYCTGVCYGFVCLASLVVVSSSQLPAKAGSDLSPDELSAFALGQSYVRTFQDYLMPGACGIVLERERCRSDFAAIQQFAGPRKMDAQVKEWLVDGDLDHKLRSWDGLMIPEATWQQKPSFAWWYTAGTLSIAAVMPQDAGTSEYVSSIVELLTKHADAAPAQFRGLIDSGGSPFDRSKPLLDALDVAIPPSPFPTVSIGVGDEGIAQLGVLNSTFAELIDNPLALSRPESRRFGLALIDQLEAADRSLGGTYSFDAIRQSLRGDIPVDAREVDITLRQPFGAWAGVLKQAQA